MANNITPVGAATGSQGKGGKKSAVTPSRIGDKRKASIRPTPVPRTDKRSEALTNMFQLLRGDPMQTSQQGVPHKVLVGDPNKDPGYLRPPTRQSVDYGERLQKAMKQEETGVYPMGWNPVIAEQRITAAEQSAPSSVTDPLRREQHGLSTTQNMGDILKGAYSKTLANIVPFTYLPGGATSRSKWANRPNEALPMRGANILRGEGTISDKMRRSRGEEAEYRHKYYGAPKPGPRESNVYDELGMPQPGPNIPDYDVGQRDVPPYLKEMGLRAEQELGPAKIPPPGSELGLPAGALITRGLSTAPYLKEETRDLIKGGFPVQDLPPGVQRFIKNTMEKPQTFFDLSGGRKGGTGEEKGEKKETFNMLKLLMGLLGLPLKLLGLGEGSGGEESGEEMKG